MLRIDSSLHDRFRVILCGCDRLSNFRPFGNFFLIAKKFINIRNADSGADTLHSHVPETWKKTMQQADLTLVRGSKI